MGLFKGVGEFFALDIGTTAIRVVELGKAGQDKWNLLHYGYATADIKVTSGSSDEQKKKLGDIILTAVGQSGIKTKNVVVGLPAQKSFSTLIDLPTMSEQELKATIKYQIDQYIPMSLDEAKFDWVSLGTSAKNPNQQEVLLASAANDFIEERLELVEGLGFNVIGMEPDSIAMVRSLLPAGINDARLLLDVGEHSTNLVMTLNDSPHLVRTIPVGLHSLVKSAVQNLNVQEDQARQFILKFGLATDRLEGQVLKAVESNLDNFVSEIQKSVKFFQNRYPEVAIGGMMSSGFASSIPYFSEYIAQKTSLPIQNANPWQKVTVPPENQQQLSMIATEFAVAVGLAQRKQ